MSHDRHFGSDFEVNLLVLDVDDETAATLGEADGHRGLGKRQGCAVKVNILLGSEVVEIVLLVLVRVQNHPVAIGVADGARLAICLESIAGSGTDNGE